jgi:hypothetical protein
MLFVIPASNLNPWDFIYQNLLDEIPAGRAYFQGLEMLPRTGKPQEILIFTDHFVETRVYINNAPVRNFVPASSVTRLKVRLLDPPHANRFAVYNGIDEPALLTVVTSHAAAHFQAWARQLYEFSGYTYEKYWSSMRSPWATFFVEYQLPWKSYLPDVRELRILSVKMAANTLFGEFGSEGGVKDFISAFTVSTPSIVPAKNKPTWQFDLFQPYRSGDDVAGFKCHFWSANVCLSRWAAFITYLDNVDAYRLGTVTEDVVKFYHANDPTKWEQHWFEPTGRECSVSGLVDYLGCMDNVTVSCYVDLASCPTICAWSHPFDSQVEYPGIGATRFFDSDLPFDSGVDLDSTYDIDLLTDYWVGASVSNSLDAQSCFDTYNAPVQTLTNSDCCRTGPDTSVFVTTATEVNTTTKEDPHNPLYGGSDLGLLANPAFNQP